MKENKLIINCYSDESGQDTRGKFFIVATIIIQSKNLSEIEKTLNIVEKESKKMGKWYATGDRKRDKYIKLLLRNKIFNKLTIYYSVYKNKLDYVSLIGSHIAKAILSYTKGKKYLAKIFIDKSNNKMIEDVKREIKLFHIRYKKIRGLTEESNIFIRLADSVCGLYRDLKNTGIPNDYKNFFRRLKEI